MDTAGLMSAGLIPNGFGSASNVLALLILNVTESAQEDKATLG